MGDSEDGGIPEDVTELRYNKLDSRLDDQVELFRDSVKHDRRMVRLLLLFLGVVATAGGYIASGGLSTGITPERHIRELHTVDTQLDVVVGIAAIFYFYSLASLLGLSTYHPKISGPTLADLKSYHSAEEYKEEKIGVLSKNLEENEEVRDAFEKKRFRANLSFLVSIFLVALIAYSILIDRPISVYLLALLAIAILIGIYVLNRISPQSCWLVFDALVFQKPGENYVCLRSNIQRSNGNGAPKFHKSIIILFGRNAPGDRPR